MLKEKREKGATVGTPSSSPHEGAATPPNTPPTSCHSMMIIKEERGVKQEHEQDSSGSPKKDISSSPRPQMADKKGDQKEIVDEMASHDQKTASQPRADAPNLTSDSEPPFASSIQPLVSNMMGKQSGGLEYMQQSSQIFVFSTTLANKGAESVLNGHFPSIIAYHCAQPGTKKILEKHPLKMGQFNRHAPWSFMNSFGPKASPGCRPKNPGVMLDTQDNLEGDGGDSSWPEGIKSEIPDDLPNGNASLVQGVKVHDDNLTPQQRQHREEQLAMLRKMRQMLFPEQIDGGEPGEIPPDGDEKAYADFLPCPNQPGAMTAPGGAYKPEWGRLPPRQRAHAHGPPPPYHQTPRSASVPIATHSPSPNSPQNLTSTLSLPSPRGGALASPSDSRHAPMRHLSAGQSPVASPAGARPIAQSSPATPSSAHHSPCPLPDDKLPGSPSKESPEKGGAFFDISPDGGGPDSMGAQFALPDDNIPLNPDTSTAPETTKVMSFDPISSLAQMSQQLTSTAPPFSAPGPQTTCSYGDMQHMREPDDAAMMECQMHGMMVPQPPDMGMHNPAAYSKILPPTAGKPLSPKMVPGGVVHGPPGGGGFPGGQLPRMGAPAGRLCPPASMADSYNGASVQVRASAPNTIQYLPARPQMCPQMPRPPPSLEFLQRFTSPMSHNGGDMGMDAGRGVRVRHETQGHMMNGVFGQMHEGLFQGPPMRHPGPFGNDKMMEPPTSQSYVGPSTTDPNYAQQFHNFQQQLYATTTRSGGAQGPPAAPYFINK